MRKCLSCLFVNSVLFFVYTHFANGTWSLFLSPLVFKRDWLLYFSRGFLPQFFKIGRICIPQFSLFHVDDCCVHNKFDKTILRIHFSRNFRIRSDLPIFLHGWYPGKKIELFLSIDKRSPLRVILHGVESSHFHKICRLGFYSWLDN